MLKKLALKASALVLSLTAQAQSTFNVKYGFGMIHNPESQVVSVGYQSQVKHSLSQQLECGAWLDPVVRQGRSGSGFCGYSLGIRVILSHVYAESLHGIGYISHPDSLLGGNFQFFHDLGLGIKDVRGYAIGAVFKHQSSAGIHKPNKGRNFMAVKMSFPIGGVK
jgi:hypothetical protein